MPLDPDEELRRELDCPDETLDLARAALVIARADYPELDIPRYLARLDRLAEAVARRSSPDAAATGSIAALNHVLFREQGYQGNRDNYYDPQNSFLNRVLDLKTGIPITLSVLYIEVGKRVGLALEGVGFPGHFLVKHPDPRLEIIVDPFNAGEICSRDNLKALLRQLYGSTVDFHPSLPQAVAKKQILQRMLSNLKLVYLGNRDWLKALSVLHRLLIVAPHSVEDLKDRGAVYLKLGGLRQALEDFEAYLSLAPDAEDSAAIRERLIELRKRAPQIH